MEKEIKWLLKDKYNDRPTEKFYKDVKRLNKGEPLDYVIGFTEFLGCRIDLSKKTLIPRPDTAFWVQKAIADIQKEKKAGVRCLDMFSGSGCIGIAILKNIPRVLCDMADSQDTCLKQAKINCRLNNINPKRYRFIKSNVFLNIKGKYNYILANPPYVATLRIDRVQRSVLKYEPRVALMAGKDGMFFIKKFLSQAKNHLNPGGKIFMEFGSEQKKEIEKLLKRYKYKNWRFIRDQYNRWRWVVAF